MRKEPEEGPSGGPSCSWEFESFRGFGGLLHGSEQKRKSADGGRRRQPSQKKSHGILRNRVLEEEATGDVFHIGSRSNVRGR